MLSTYHLKAAEPTENIRFFAWRRNWFGLTAKLLRPRVAFCVVWAIALEKQNQKRERKKETAGFRSSVGARLPAIYREAVAKSGDSVLPDTPHAPDLLPVPSRSRASALLQLTVQGR
ncbi:hypothetical protein [Pseudomonas sp. S2_H01]